ncbi:hypothetical protein GGP56_002394 [Salinibacter ruber]|nr:hypothetical protein [Salinibacter ruber]MCS4195630.1 hypothetical protein [Salinibacter ruber]
MDSYRYGRPKTRDHTTGACICRSLEKYQSPKK